MAGSGRVGIEKVFVLRVARPQVDELFKAGNALQDEEPAFSEVVALVGGKLNETLDAGNVFGFESFVGGDEGEFGERAHERISLRLHVEKAADFD